MSPRWGSTPRLTDWLTVSRNVTLTLTWLWLETTSVCIWPENRRVPTRQGPRTVELLAEDTSPRLTVRECCNIEEETSKGSYKLWIIVCVCVCKCDYPINIRSNPKTTQFLVALPSKHATIFLNILNILFKTCNIPKNIQHIIDIDILYTFYIFYLIFVFIF
jgi:hypothetical protein